MDREAVIALMKTSASAREWNANCVAVKKACGGGYPAFWYEAILQSGLAREIMAKFGGSPDITVGI